MCNHETTIDSLNGKLFVVHHLVYYPFPNRAVYSSHGAYSQSKLALVLFTYYLQEQLTSGGFSVTVNAVDPGMVDTALYDNLWTLAQMMKKPVASILFRVCLSNLNLTLSRLV